MLPRDIRVRERIYPDVEARSDRVQITAAYLGLGMNVVALAVSIAGWGIPHQNNPLAIVFPLAFALLPFNLFILGFCRRSLRSPIPRPTIDRPWSLVFIMTYPPGMVLVFTLAGILTKTYSWNWAAWIGAIALTLSLVANFCWAVETGRRWNLAYEVTRS